MPAPPRSAHVCKQELLSILPGLARLQPGAQQSQAAAVAAAAAAAAGSSSDKPGDSDVATAAAPAGPTPHPMPQALAATLAQVCEWRRHHP